MRDQPVARRRIEIARPAAQPIEMQAGRLGRGDDVRSRARELGLRYLDIAIGAKRRRYPIDGMDRFGAPAFEITAGDRNPQPLGAALQERRDRLDRAIDANRIVRVVALHGVIGERQIVRAARHRSDMIETGAERKSAGAAKPSVGRLEAEQAAQRRRHPDRTVGVGAERERHESAADRCRRSARRSSRHAAAIVRIVSRPIVRVLAGEVVGIFAHVERADENGARLFQPLDQCRIARSRRRIAIDLRAGKRRQAGDVEQVLHRERHPSKSRQRLAACA